MKTHFYTADAGEYNAAMTNQGATDEGNCGYIFAAYTGATIPLYRTMNPKAGTHFYTTFIDERDDAVNEEGYKGEGIAGYCYPVGGPGIPLYRASNPATGDHLYTLDAKEIQAAAPAYQSEGTACNVLAAATGNAVWLHRFRDPTGLHFYTANDQEYKMVKAAGQLTYEGEVGFVFPTPPAGPAPLFRSYNPANGSHLYTLDIAEHDNAANNLGMRADGITGYLFRDGEQPAGTQKLYRDYSAASNDHFYTIDATEAQNAANYSQEGVTGWVLTAAVGSSTSGAVVLHRLMGDFTGDFLLGSVGPKGLTSNSNYVLNSVVGASCNPIIGLTLTIDVTGSIVLKSNSGGTAEGFSFQLNAYSVNKSNCGYQQYVIALQDSTLYGVVNNYPTIGGSGSILNWDSLASVSGSTLPAGYKLTISLQNDSAGNVTGVNFQVFDDSGKSIGSKTRSLKDISGIKALGTAPIAGFVLNLVGPSGGEQAILNPGGAGVITYAATSILRASNQGPSCATDNLAFFTVETANSVYGQMPASASFKLIQTFNTNGTTETIGLKSPFRRALQFLPPK